MLIRSSTQRALTYSTQAHTRETSPNSSRAPTVPLLTLPSSSAVAVVDMGMMGVMDMLVRQRPLCVCTVHVVYIQYIPSYSILTLAIVLAYRIVYSNQATKGLPYMIYNYNPPLADK